MTVKDIIDILECEVVVGREEQLGQEVSTIGASDMMSDILALSRPGMLVITGHTSPQSVRTGVVTDLLGLVIARGKQIPQETIDLAVKHGFLVLKTQSGMFTSCGKLYRAGCRGGDEA
jgi:predicted transcriptional regulator